MRIKKDIFEVIKKYLEIKENADEREQLFKWYDNLSTGHTLDRKKIVAFKRKNLERLSGEIGLTTNPGKFLDSPWIRIAASMLIIATCFLAYKYSSRKYEPVQLSNNELKKIVPASNQVLINLSSGKRFNPDTIAPGTAVKIGDITVEKDRSGNLIYNAQGDNEDKFTTSEVITPGGSQFKLRLPDGTEVYLNAKSKLSFPGSFGNGDRVVKLTGEAYFEVTKSAHHRRFLVETEKQRIEVLGTKFNVNAYERIPFVKTTLAEGSVRIYPKNRALKQLIIKPNQQAVLTQKDLVSIAVDAKQIIAWKDGYFVFDGKNTVEVMREIGEWYGVKVDISPGVKSIKYAGKIPKNIDMARLVNLLSYADVNVRAIKGEDNAIRLIVK